MGGTLSGAGRWLGSDECLGEIGDGSRFAFPGMAHGNLIAALGGATVVERTLLNASHGSIGGTPGYNPHLVSPPNEGYVYATDRDNSILSGKSGTGADCSISSYYVEWDILTVVQTWGPRLWFA